MSTRNLEVSKLYFDKVWKNGDYSTAKQIFSENAIFYPSSSDNQVMGIEALMNLDEAWRKSFDSLDIRIQNQVANESHVVTNWAISGKIKQSFEGIDAVGKEIQLEGVTIMKFEEGKIIEGKSFWDKYKLLKQISDDEVVIQELDAYYRQMEQDC